jgi:hypothetical protein
MAEIFTVLPFLGVKTVLGRVTFEIQTLRLSRDLVRAPTTCDGPVRQLQMDEYHAKQSLSRFRSSARTPVATVTAWVRVSGRTSGVQALMSSCLQFEPVVFCDVKLA